MRISLLMAGVVTACTLMILCRVFFYYRKKRQLITTKYRVKVHTDKEECIALISYQDETGNKQVWLYENEWEKTVQLPGNRCAALMVSARYLGKELDWNEYEVTKRPLVTGEIVYNDRILREEKQKMISLEFPY